MAVTINGSTGIVVPDGTAGAPSITGSTSANIAFTTNTISFNTNSAERMRIDSSGNVSIGTTTTSLAKFTAASSSSTTTFLSNIIARIQSNGSGADSSLQFSDNTSYSAGISLNQGNLAFSLGGTRVAQFEPTNGFFQMNNGYGSVATAYGCRAWVNYNATGSAIRASAGLTSVTKNGTGDYTLNFSVTMPDTSYSVVGTANAYNSYQGLVVCIQSMSTTTVNIRNTQGNNNGAAEGNISGGAASMLCISIFR